MSKYSKEDLYSAIVPWGSMDIDEMLSLCNEYEINLYTVIEEMEEKANDIGVHLSELDPVASVYEHILNIARSEIEELTKKDILNDTEQSAYVFSNYLDSSIQIDSKDAEEIKRWIKEAWIKESLNRPAGEGYQKEEYYHLKFSPSTLYFIEILHDL